MTPNPFTSGGARWNVMAAYGAQRKLGKTDKQAIAYLNRLFNHVPVQRQRTRGAHRSCEGKGDALLTYENEAIFAQQEGRAHRVQLPKATILIENPVASPRAGRTRRRPRLPEVPLVAEGAEALRAERLPARR